MKRVLLVLALLVACGGGGASDGGLYDGPANNGTSNDGDCPEKDQMLATQDLAEDPNGPGGTRITDSELRDIQDAIANVPSDC